MISNILSGRQNREKLEDLIQRARRFDDAGDRHALEDLQRLIARPLQSLHMVDAYLKPAHGAVKSLLPEDIGFPFDYENLKKMDAPAAVLGRDIVLPTSWSPGSMDSMTGKIGPGRNCGRFKGNLNCPYNRILVSNEYILGTQWQPQYCTRNFDGRWHSDSRSGL